MRSCASDNFRVSGADNACAASSVDALTGSATGWIACSNAALNAFTLNFWPLMVCSRSGYALPSIQFSPNTASALATALVRLRTGMVAISSAVAASLSTGAASTDGGFSFRFLAYSSRACS